MPTTTRSATVLVVACAVVLLLPACRPTADPATASPPAGTPGATASAADTAPPAAPHATASLATEDAAPSPTATPSPAAGTSAPDVTPTPGPGVTTAPRTVTLPTPGARFEYQLGGADEPSEDTAVVVRDSTATPTGRYDVCYVNGFQTQPSQTERLLRAEPALVLHHAGEPVRDDGWPDEVLYDLTTPELRARVAERVGHVIDACGAAGFDAVEVDNLDSYTRSLGRITPADTLAYTALLVERAHAAGLAFAQKNTAELTTQVRALGADLVVAEECREWQECHVYTAAYPVVLDVEYDRAAFDAACAEQSSPATRAAGLSVVLRDRDVAPRGAPEAVHEAC
ncbi:endo alpha-1,4 polygalactosaminidase [Cellulomonas dongxiuzhuiae]|uniref:Endo alpha-1,4 polygalactosaminidase n=1 Tax=Cellulomonas dongxiuzhuiae TaxID=2819979 RepID=A0ABX8GJN8_9CELL|nr:endo alpha-1,4 polygalactosaminidase [Cellulomonas dongxiuzhuiae]MBO3095161.1 endo alpha-1,4 polygalactosaminidase [Cellulomonas dongxiuzhuiae]QWC16165.1 endo alpha-1,4 polygalactosaminidase [Cellulomonas dongxiuzhuiae]